MKKQKKIYRGAAAFLIAIGCIYVYHTFHVPMQYLKTFKQAFETEMHPEFLDARTVWVEQQDKVHQGYLLVKPYSDINADKVSAYLFDQTGEIVHEWQVISKDIVRDEDLEDYFSTTGIKSNQFLLHIVDAHVLQDGDMILNFLKIYENTIGMYPFSYLVRIDKDSNVKWARHGEGSFHHEFEINKAGQVIAIESTLEKDFPLINYQDFSNIRYIDAVIHVIDPDTGDTLESFSVTEAFLKSGHTPYLSLAAHGEDDVIKTTGLIFLDPYHANDVVYIEQNVANAVPFLEKGDILVSLKHLDLVAAVRPSENAVIWARRGPWHGQHYLEIDDKGILTLVDNIGYRVFTKHKDNMLDRQYRLRILEYNILNDTSKTIFRHENPVHFPSPSRSSYARLDNGHLLITFTDQGRVIQVDENNGLVWEFRATKDRMKQYNYLHRKSRLLTRYYPADTLRVEDW